MQFKSIVGQESIKQKLVKSVDDGRVPHAQLFVGSAGAGKLALAVAYAQYLMCTNRTSGDSCGECPSCKKIQKLVHPDLHFVYPVNTSEKSEQGDDDDAATDTISLWREQLIKNPYFTEPEWYDALDMKNKQGIISAAAANDVIKKLSLKGYESDYKVMIIWLPERMNSAAANKLLKLIEEPPPKTVFLLVSDSPNLLLKTITSRTQQVLVPPISRASIEQALVGLYDVEPDVAKDISRVSNGSFSEALYFMESAVSEHFERYAQLMRLCYAKNHMGLLAWSDEVAKLGREGIKEFVSYSLRLTRNSFMLNLGLDDLSFLMGQEAEFAKKFSPFINQQNIYRIVAELSRVNEHIAQNANANIVFTDFVLKMSNLIRAKTN